MKVQFFEGKFGSEISLEPETLKEATELAKFVLNAKAVPPQIWLHFNENGQQSCSVWMEAVSEKVRKTSLSNKKNNQ